MSEPPERIAVILLAAGASRRMGRPKQLLKFRGEAMIERLTRLACALPARPVVLVLGARAARITDEVTFHSEAELVVNPDWKAGMSTSVRAGLRRALAIDPDLGGALFMVVDQPFVDEVLLRRLLDGYRRTHAPIVAARYDDRPGVPALFDRTLFPELEALVGDRGARPLFDRHRTTLQTVPFPRGRFDLDTPEDYRKLEEEE